MLALRDAVGLSCCAGFGKARLLFELVNVLGKRFELAIQFMLAHDFIITRHCVCAAPVSVLAVDRELLRNKTPNPCIFVQIKVVLGERHFANCAFLNGF